MSETLLPTAGVVVLIFAVAALYASVGHGGASGYLAILSMLAFSPSAMKPTALLLNIVVAGIAFVTYTRARYFVPQVTWPFLITSIPAAFLGGMLPVGERLYFLLLAFALVVAAIRLVTGVLLRKEGELRPLSLPLAMLIGAIIGLLSGMIGIGGGIFLSPLVLFLRWADVRQTAATAAAFIVVNSLAGLGGHLTQGHCQVGAIFPFLIAAILGGFVGSYWGAYRFSRPTLRVSLALVLVFAAAKLLIVAV